MTTQQAPPTISLPKPVLVVSDVPAHLPGPAHLLPVMHDMIGGAARIPARRHHLGTGGAPDGSDLLAEARRAHALVLLSRVRNNSCSAELQTALDRLASGVLRRKPVGIVAVGADPGTHAVDHLRVVLAAFGAVVIPTSLHVPADGTPGPSAARPHERTRVFVDELLWFATRLRDDPAPPHTPEPETGSAAVQVAAAVSYITENITDAELTLESAARAARMSKYHFSRTFKKHTGTRFIDFVTDLRMERARVLLEATDQRVADICESVGYRDLTHFQRTFKAAFAVTPTVYRSAAHAGLTFSPALGGQA